MFFFVPLRFLFEVVETTLTLFDGPVFNGLHGCTLRMSIHSHTCQNRTSDVL